jgi:hypothetical protein
MTGQQSGPADIKTSARAPHPPSSGADALRPPAHPGQRPHREDELIPKVHERGPMRGLSGLLRYLFGPGENNARGGIHHNPRIIAAWAYATCGNLAELQPPLQTNGRHSLRRLTELLEQPVRIGFNPPTLPVWHCSVHNHPDDPILVTAADQAEQTPTGFCAQAVLDAAHAHHAPADEQPRTHTLARLQAELLRTRIAINQLRVELNRTRDDSRASPDSLNSTIATAAARSPTSTAPSPASIAGSHLQDPLSLRGDSAGRPVRVGQRQPRGILIAIG